MAQTKANTSDAVLMRSLTDCMDFVNSHCEWDEECYFRHCREAAEQSKTCLGWPNKCRDVNCLYRHPAVLPIANNPQPPASPQRDFVSFFWDIENVPIPKGQKSFDIVQRIRQKLVTEPDLREYMFSCYCNSTTISEQNQLSLHHANVRIVHVPDRKPGAVDRQILLDLDRFERAHRPPATVVLISGDIDFVGKLSDLRHQAGFHVIVIHNKPAKEELKLTVNAHYPWEAFTQPEQQQTNEPNVIGAWMYQPVPLIRIPTSTLRQYRSAHRQNYPQPTSEALIPISPAINKSSLGAHSPMMSTVPVIRSRHASSSHSRRRTDHSRDRRRSYSQKRPAPMNPNGKNQQQKGSPHSCPQCTNQFDSIQAFRQHQVAKHHVFECPVCKEGFFTLDGQIQHQKNQRHQEQKFKCAKCLRSFTTDSGLNQHKQATGHVDILFPPSLPQTSSKLHLTTIPLPPLNERF